jgi:hypothetical protein
MKKTVLISIVAGISLNCSMVKAQDADTISASRWNHYFGASFYIMKDDFFVLPVYQVNKDWLHLEARYNYEDRNTFSAWFGYNFSGGNRFEYNITPMVGGIAGNTNGIAPGLELNFVFYGFEFYSESEYLFDLKNSEGNFYYNWTDFSYSPLDWLWFGISIQRTKLYETDLEVQRGLLLGGGYRWFGLNCYLYNLGWDDPYLIITLSANIPEQ